MIPLGDDKKENMNRTKYTLMHYHSERVSVSLIPGKAQDTRVWSRR